MLKDHTEPLVTVNLDAITTDAYQKGTRGDDPFLASTAQTLINLQKEYELTTKSHDLPLDVPKEFSAAVSDQPHTPELDGPLTVAQADSLPVQHYQPLGEVGFLIIGLTIFICAFGNYYHDHS
jgi:hypothetical protein